jgi:hypothetical protein
MGDHDPNPVRERHWVCAQRLRERRLTLGLTQREVVDLLQRRGSHTTNRGLSAMENGRGLDLGLLPDLAFSLGCTITYLLGLTTDPSAWQPAETSSAPLVGSLAVPGVNGVDAVGPGTANGFAARAVDNG